MWANATYPLALAEMCRHLDATETKFPGTNLRLRYEVAGVVCDI